VSTWFRTYGFADVLDELLIGAYPLDEGDVEMLARMRVQVVLNLVEDAEYRPGERAAVEAALADAGIEERRLALVDYGRLPAPQLETVVQEVLAWLEEGKRVYLHCRAGWQRSAAVAAGVVAIREGVEIEDALARVKQRKHSADPLPEQREDLLSWWSERRPRAAEGSPPAAEGPVGNPTQQP
jgi:protein-tyrosine phosphatase